VHIWIDGDACPVVIRDILFRAAIRRGIDATLVANQAVPVPRSPHIRCLQVPHGFDQADDEIVRRIASGDIVVTGDIPLAAAAIARGARVLSPRGEPFTAENIGQRLAMRNLMDQLRSTGAVHGGPAPLDQRDRQAFANALDRLLTATRRDGQDTSETEGE
jgi:uncharacterized protein